MRPMVGAVLLFASAVWCTKEADASLLMATASDLAGGELVTFEAPSVVSSPYTPTAGGVTFSSDDTFFGIDPAGSGTALAWEGDLAPLCISFDAPAIATHWLNLTGVPPNQVELFSDSAFTSSLGTFDISAFGVNGGTGFTSDEAFSSMKLLGSSSANLDDFRYASAVPEPSSALMMVLVLLGMGARNAGQRYKRLLSD